MNSIVKLACGACGTRNYEDIDRQIIWIGEPSPKEFWELLKKHHNPPMVEEEKEDER
jgi:hypothetical protein